MGSGITFFLRFIFIFLMFFAKGCTDKSQSLNNLLSTPNCPPVCWLDIIVGTTTESDLINIFETKSIEYELYQLGMDGPGQGFEFVIINHNSQLPILPEFVASVSVYGVEGVVTGFKLYFIDLSVSDVVDAYGIPQLMMQDTVDNSVYLVYPQDAIVFHVLNDGNFIFTAVISNTAHIERVYIQDAYFMEDFQPCSEPTQICAISAQMSPRD